MDFTVFLDKMKNNGKSIIKSNGDDAVEYAVLLAINNELYKNGLITKEEMEAIAIEILREK